MPDTSATPSIHGPYEDALIALFTFLTKLIDGQPPEVRKQLWDWYVEDVKAWRDFWKSLQ